MIPLFEWPVFRSSLYNFRRIIIFLTYLLLQPIHPDRIFEAEEANVQVVQGHSVIVTQLNPPDDVTTDEDDVTTDEEEEQQKRLKQNEQQSQRRKPARQQQQTERKIGFSQ